MENRKRRGNQFRKIRLFINGFGRIGRHIARIILHDGRFELAGINDLADFEQMGQMLKYDSLYGDFPPEISVVNNVLYVDGVSIPLFRERDPKKLVLHHLDVDLLVASCGMFLTRESCRPFLDNGARRVILSTPPADEIPVYIYGVNHKDYASEAIISNSSCSANAIVPICKIVDCAFGIRSGMLSMYHSYTSYQRLLDSKHYANDIRRTRSATQNIIPLESSAAKATTYFFPHLKEKFYAKSIRIPLAATTFYSLAFHLKKETTEMLLHTTFEASISSGWSGILGLSDLPKVSSDYIGDPHSAVLDRASMCLPEKNLLHVGAWQDNEYGYARRLVDLAASIYS